MIYADTQRPPPPEPGAVAVPGQERRAGFSLLEIIVVMMVMAILTTSFVGRMMTSDAELIAGTQALRAHLRYAQSKAMGTGVNWYVQFSTTASPGSYALYKSGTGIQTFPGESGTAVNLQDGMSVPGGNGTVVLFDSLGRPYSDAAATTRTTADWQIVTTTSSAAGNVAVKPETGYIP